MGLLWTPTEWSLIHHQNIPNLKNVVLALQNDGITNIKQNYELLISFDYYFSESGPGRAVGCKVLK